MNAIGRRKSAFFCPLPFCAAYLCGMQATPTYWKARARDGWQFMRRLSFPRVLNAFQVVSSYYISRALRKPHHRGQPLSISLEPTTSCNLRCPECPSGLRSFSRPRGMLDAEAATNIINQVAAKTPYLLLYFQGEPYLNPAFFDVVRAGADKKMYVATSTNGHYLTEANARKTIESGLARLIISIDGTTQDVYSAYRRGGSLQKVLDGAERLVRLKKEMKSATPHIIFQFLVVKPNEHQLQDVIRLADEIGVDEVKFKSAQVYDYENGNELIPTVEKYSRYKKLPNGKYRLKGKLMNHCWKMWHSCVVTWDGSIVPCCFDKDARYKLGSLSNNSFEDIWHSPAYNRFRAALLRDRMKIDICQNCTEGSQVWL